MAVSVGSDQACISDRVKLTLRPRHLLLNPILKIQFTLKVVIGAREAEGFSLLGFGRGRNAPFRAGQLPQLRRDGLNALGTTADRDKSDLLRSRH